MPACPRTPPSLIATSTPPDLHLILAPEPISERDFYGSDIAEIDNEACRGCGACVQLCRFDAISLVGASDFRVDALACEGCGVACGSALTTR